MHNNNSFRGGMNNAKKVVNICIHWDDWFMPLMPFTALRTQVDARSNIVNIAAYFLLCSSVRISFLSEWGDLVRLDTRSDNRMVAFMVDFFAAKKSASLTFLLLCTSPGDFGSHCPQPSSFLILYQLLIYVGWLDALSACY